MTAEKYDILAKALVPEHSVDFMQAMSGGTAFCQDGFLFLRGEDWLMGIGYPLAEKDISAPDSREPESASRQAAFPDTRNTGRGDLSCFPFDPAVLTRDFEAALYKAIQSAGSVVDCYIIAPQLPDTLERHAVNKDNIYVLDACAPVPAALRRPVAGAAQRLTVTLDRSFTASHRRLWAEFLSRRDLAPNVRELYARTEAMLAAARAREMQGQNQNPDQSLTLDVRLLSAWDAGGNLASALLLDYSPKNFCAYIIGAHSRDHYSPHATDLLFSIMLEQARKEGKQYIHLGLGVNEGIARFKRKWGGKPVLSYAMAAWKEQTGQRPAVTGKTEQSEVSLAMRALLSAPADMSKQQIFDTLPQQRSFAMIFEVRKGNALSYLCGSAHFFRYSFEFAFRKLFAPLHTVIFEGPLDEEFLAAVEHSGRNPEPGSARILDAMSEEEIQRLERTVYGWQGPLPRLLGIERPRKLELRELLADCRPWFAFFSTWVAYLEGQGWQESVDLEAWRTAKDMGKAVIAMENLEEQLASLESVPMPRIVDFFRRCREWPSYARRNIKTYLSGDLERMMGSSIEFPSRTESVIEFRDERFRVRMRPFLEAGNCAVFVGTAHLVGLIPMLRQDGFEVRQACPTFGLRLRACLRRPGRS